jgi:predicted dehydrogenase
MRALSEIDSNSLSSKFCSELNEWEKIASESKLKVAIIGLGKMGLLHSGILNLLVPGIVRAIVDKSPLLTFGASRMVKSAKFYRNVEKMLRDIEPDAVYVTTPTGSHYSITKTLLESGLRYVFVEKPPTVSFEQLRDLVSLKRKEQSVMVGFQKRYALTFRHAKMLLEEGAIGEVKEVKSYIKSGDILEPTTRFNALGRGVLLDLGVHLVDLLSYFFKIKGIAKAESKSIYTGVDDEFRAELEAEDGFSVFMEASWSSQDFRVPETYIEIQGSDGTLMVTEDYLKFSHRAEEQSLEKSSEFSLYKPHYYKGIPPVNLADPEYTLENIHFIKSIVERRDPMTSLEGSYQTMELIDELYKEAKKTG